MFTLGTKKGKAGEERAPPRLHHLRHCNALFFCCAALCSLPLLCCSFSSTICCCSCSASFFFSAAAPAHTLSALRRRGERKTMSSLPFALLWWCPTLGWAPPQQQSRVWCVGGVAFWWCCSGTFHCNTTIFVATRFSYTLRCLRRVLVWLCLHSHTSKKS